MKNLLITIIFTLICSVCLNAQTSRDDLEKRIVELEDRIAIKNLVDTFSILADQKEAQKQTLFFTEDATSNTYTNGQLSSSLKGRKQIGEAFANFLNRFETVYHINGQQTVSINGNNATGTSYCLVILISSEDGMRMKRTIGAYYNDEFVKQNNRWLISNRKATFSWQESQELAQ